MLSGRIARGKSRTPKQNTEPLAGNSSNRGSASLMQKDGRHLLPSFHHVGMMSDASKNFVPAATSPILRRFAQNYNEFVDRLCIVALGIVGEC